MKKHTINKALSQKKLPLIAFFILLISSIACTQRLTFKEKSDNKLYELRIYFPEENKLPYLLQRFENHTLKLFEKHGIENIAYFTTLPKKLPQELTSKLSFKTPQHPILIYIIAHQNHTARKTSFAAFSADPEWQRAYKESRLEGPLIQKIESVFLKSAFFLP